MVPARSGRRPSTAALGASTATLPSATTPFNTGHVNALDQTAAAPATDRRRGVVAAVVLLALGAWTTATPYLGRAWELNLNVASKVEVVDHVVPGVVIVAASAVWLLHLMRSRAGEDSAVPLAAISLCFLGGLWVTSTHVPTVAKAGDPLVPWDAALFHSATGPVLLVLSLALLIPRLRAGPEA